MYLQTDEIEQLYEWISSYKTIIIHRHVRPDPDAIGSQLGLKFLILAQFPNKRVLAAGTMTKGLAWLGEMDKVKREDYQDALVIVCDTANQPRVDGRYYNTGDKLVKIDHHIVNDKYGDLQIVHPQASSTSEIVTMMSHLLGDRLSMNDEAAKLLYAGLVGDTGRFMYSTTPEAFKTASFLIDYDFDARAINDAFQLISVNESKFHGYVYNNLNINDSGVAYLVITRKDMERFGISEEQTNSIVNIPSRIEGVYVWVIFIEQLGNAPKWRTRIRSKGPIINEIAAKYDGGGHAMASGAKAYKDDEIPRIIEDLSKAADEYTKDKS